MLSEKQQNDKIKELATTGATNAEIFGALEITAGTLIALLQTQPSLIFNIIQARAEYLSHYLKVIEEYANGLESTSRFQYQAAVYLVERAELQNKQLTIAHELALVTGSPATATHQNVSSTKVTELLRRTK